MRFSAVGHAHLDLAWLWPMRESFRKGARTFSHILKMMERYPEFRFAASQAQLYQWMKDRYPALYAREKKKLRTDDGDAITASWVEFRYQYSLEALVRQILYGKDVCEEEFGIDVRPASFLTVSVYTGALPQLLKKSGVGIL